MPLITPEIRAQLIENGLRAHHCAIETLRPACWIFDSRSDRIWLPTTMQAGDPDTAWGLVMSDYGSPVVGPISLDVLEAFPSVQARDPWKAMGPLSAYIIAASQAGGIVDLDDDVLPTYTA